VMRHPDRARGLVLIDAALGLTAAPSPAPSMISWVIQPQWIREILVSLTITNPVATQMLLKSMIAKKERALPEYVAILQHPLAQRDSTSDIADWLYYFLGSDTTAASADRAAYAKLEAPVAILWGDKDTITPLEQARDLQTLLPPEPELTLLPGLGHIPQIEDPAMFNDALLKTLARL
jgi:pimeloyl-ACP methyl ester carboxylesterase